MNYGFDIETVGPLNPYLPKGEVLTAVLWNEDSTHVWRRDRPNSVVPTLLADPQTTIIGHNLLTFDIPYWERRISPIKASMWDTRVLYALINEDGAGNSLDDLVRRYLTDEVKNEQGLDVANLGQYPIEKVLRYNLDDARQSFKLFGPLWNQLYELGLHPLATYLHCNVAPALRGMMDRGVNLDIPYIEEQQILLAERASEIEEEIRSLLKRNGFTHDLNLGSAKQLCDLLYKEMGLPVLVETKTGSPSTGKPALIRLEQRAREAGLEPIASLFSNILETRRVSKLAGTYLSPLKSEHLAADWRVHTAYHLGKGADPYNRNRVSGTVSGRLSSSSPNLQNIPRDGTVKGAFIPTHGWYFVDADYSQLEIRVAAWYSKEPAIYGIFERGEDFHTATCARLYKVPYQTVVDHIADGSKLWKERRSAAKTINFGILYGMGPPAIQGNLQEMGIWLSLKECASMLRKWHRAYPVLSEWIEGIKDKAILFGYVETPLGRRRHLPGAIRNDPEGEKALRQAVNFLVQSLASDFTLIGLAKMEEKSTPTFRLALTVHDSIVAEYDPESHTEEDVVETVYRAMVTDTLTELNRLAPTTDWSDLVLSVDIETEKERLS